MYTAHSPATLLVTFPSPVTKAYRQSTVLMADTSHTDQLAKIRALAQQHLIEIEIEKGQEQAQLSQAEIDIQRYSKMSSFDRKRQHSTRTTSADRQRSRSSEDSQQQPLEDKDLQDQTSYDMGLAQKKDRFRPFHEVLHRLRWDPKFNIEDYVVGYLERFDGIKVLPASNWIQEYTHEDWIPMHRVRYVQRTRISWGYEEGPEKGIVWDRDMRLDRISKQNESEEDLLSIDGTSVTGGMSV